MENQPAYSQNLAHRKIVGAFAYVIFLTAVIIGVGGLIVLLVQVFVEGVPWLSWDFLTNYPSRKAELAGIRAAILGTIWLMVFVGIFTIPVGVGAAIYLEEYAPKNRLTRLIEINIGNLAGVPSVVYGLLGLALFVQWLSMGRSIVSAALTLALLVLPIVILASREAIRSVPASHRQAAFALGATKWDVVRSVVLPSAVPRHAHWHDSRHVQGDRRSGPGHLHKRPGLPDIRPFLSIGPLHCPAHTDIRLGQRA